MNKQEMAVVVLLFAALMGWTYVNRGSMGGAPKDAQGIQSQAVAGQDSSVSASGSDVPDMPLDREVITAVKTTVVEDSSSATLESESVRNELPEQTVNISNDKISVTVSSWGGVVTAAQLKEYKATLAPDSGPIVFDFSSSPSLAISGIPEFSTAGDFAVSVQPDGKSVIAEAVGPQNIKLSRKIEIAGDYRLQIVDTFTNEGDVPVQIKEYNLGVGPMINMEADASSSKGYNSLGIDTLSSQGGSDVIYWDKKGPNGMDGLTKQFDEGCRAGGGFLFFKASLLKQLPRNMIPVVIKEPTDWVAVKNKFFVQILAPKEEGAGYILNASREVPVQEDANNSKSWSKSATVASVSASMIFPGRTIQSRESFSREVSYFVGPKKNSELKALGRHQDQIMFRAWRGWGWYRWVCAFLLMILNKLYAVIPNYGVAIILLTIIVKVVFWPVMQKSTESMKKMQSLKPHIDVLKEKYKNNPQKMQQEQMALYKKHKVNPMASCLPMLIQMPVFIAMFTVIRSAVELRYASFLWISDLSEPERLFNGMIPVIGYLNVLPLLMVATMVWQQKLTPSTGDAQQKQMMVIMPVMMLFLLYNMASGLTLYWTVSQVLSIVQLYVQKK